VGLLVIFRIVLPSVLVVLLLKVRNLVFGILEVST
jgi:hypothetical protein